MNRLITINPVKRKKGKMHLSTWIELGAISTPKLFIRILNSTVKLMHKWFCGML